MSSKKTLNIRIKKVIFIISDTIIPDNKRKNCRLIEYTHTGVTNGVTNIYIYLKSSKATQGR